MRWEQPEQVSAINWTQRSSRGKQGGKLKEHQGLSCATLSRVFLFFLLVLEVNIVGFLIV